MTYKNIYYDGSRDDDDWEYEEEMKEKIAEIIREEYHSYYNAIKLADKILDLILKNIQVEVECPECSIWNDLGGYGKSCIKCRGTGKTFRPATIDDLEKGGVLKNE